MNDTSAPDAGGVQGMPEQPPLAVSVPPTPVAKPKTNVPLFLAGLCTPVAVVLLLAWGAGAAQTAYMITVMSIAFPGAISIMFVASLVVFLNKRKSGGMLWSFAKGTLWSYIALVLLFLVAFGTCVIGLPPF